MFFIKVSGGFDLQIAAKVGCPPLVMGSWVQNCKIVPPGPGGLPVIGTKIVRVPPQPFNSFSSLDLGRLPLPLPLPPSPLPRVKVVVMAKQKIS